MACMIACLYDVHGNLDALDAVLADARAQGAARWILGGDYALFGPQPRETVERLRELEPAVWIRGNGGRWTAHPDEAPENAVVPGAAAACREALGPALVAELAGLPMTAALDDDTLVCHASPRSDTDSFFSTPSPDEAELLAGATAQRMLFGHTHVPFRRISAHGGIELINPGSVGMPFDSDPRAAYALLHPDRRVEHRRVAYDHAAAARRMRDGFEGAEWAEIVARRIEAARMED